MALKLRSSLVLVVAVLATSMQITRALTVDSGTRFSGAREIANAIREHDLGRIAILHPRIAHQHLEPQLAYYTQGLTAGWKDSSVKKLDYSQATEQHLSELRKEGSLIVSRHFDEYSRDDHPDRVLADNIEAVANRLWSYKLGTRSYALYY